MITGFQLISSLPKKIPPLRIEVCKSEWMKYENEIENKVENKIRILHIDDNLFDRKLIWDALVKDDGRFEILEADSREKFEQHLRGQDFDLVLSDFDILGFDGLQVLQLVKEKNPDIPVIIVTGTGSEEIAIQAMKMGAEDYVIKTMHHLRGLGSTIDVVLDNKKARDERKIIQEKLQESEGSLNTLIKTIPDPLCLKDPAGRFLKSNPAFESLMGIKESELIGKTDFDLFPPEMANHSHEKDLEAIAKGEKTRDEETYPDRKGQKRIFDIIRAPMYDSEGKLIGVLSIGRDITERKRTAELLKNYSFQLEETVKSRTADLEASKERAESADKLKSDFLSNVSHELRTPLNSIIGFTGILLNRMAGPLNEEQEKQLNMVKASGKHLLALINDILDLSKIESERFILNAETINMQSLIEEVVEQHLPIDKDVSLNFEQTPEIIEIQSDRQRVKQVLINLVSNGLKFTESGSVNIHCFREIDTVVVEISDTGIGIEEENLDKIFNQFFQIETQYSSKFPGTGLGLSICRKIMELLHGTITVKSKVGIGSVFTCTFPVEIPAEGAV